MRLSQKERRVIISCLTMVAAGEWPEEFDSDLEPEDAMSAQEKIAAGLKPIRRNRRTIIQAVASRDAYLDGINERLKPK